MIMSRKCFPAGIWRLYNVVPTSMQRHDVASTLIRRCITYGHMTFIQRRTNVDATSRRCIDVDTTLYKRHMPAGNAITMEHNLPMTSTRKVNKLWRIVRIRNKTTKIKITNSVLYLRDDHNAMLFNSYPAPWENCFPRSTFDSIWLQISSNPNLAT